MAPIPGKPHGIFERKAQSAGARRVAGVDEAGRGPWAGPVVAAAVVFLGPYRHRYLNDSKKVDPLRRQEVAHHLRQSSNVHFCVAEASHEEVDSLNILQATFLAMRRALAGLPEPPDYVLVDGNHFPNVGVAGRSIIGGDGRSASIAAASILAKEHRDSVMAQWDVTYPMYGFAQHKGYGTPAHEMLLRKHGPSPIHRRSFAPVRSAESPGLCLDGAEGELRGAGGVPIPDPRGI